MISAIANNTLSRIDSEVRKITESHRSKMVLRSLQSLATYGLSENYVVAFALDEISTFVEWRGSVHDHSVQIRQTIQDKVDVCTQL